MMDIGTAILSTLGSVGGVAALIGGLSAFLGNVWANRILEREKAALARDLESQKSAFLRDLEAQKASWAQQLEELRSQLQLSREQAKRVSEARFKLYNDVWTTLQDLKTIGDQLWERAAAETIEKFATALTDARIAANRGRIILRERDYQSLGQVFESFANYEVGKQRLVEIRSQAELESNARNASETLVRDQVHANSKMRAEYERLLDGIVIHFRAELGIAA